MYIEYIRRTTNYLIEYIISLFSMHIELTEDVILQQRPACMSVTLADLAITCCPNSTFCFVQKKKILLPVVLMNDAVGFKK